MIPPGPPGVKLPDSVFVILRDLIQDRTGVIFADDKREVLEDKLRSRIGALSLDSYLDYFYLLRYGAGAEEEWPFVQDAIAVPETYFWREMDQIWALVNRVVPKLAAGAVGTPINIWCAACASGEEALTIAMVLHNSGWLDRAEIRLSASDASPQAIERARNGLFSERSCRHLPAEYRDKYFLRDGAGWRISPDIHATVNWQRANLCDPETIEPYLKAAAVFCRNVFIYFSPEAIQATVALFSRRLPRPAYLFLGVAESLVGHKTDFELQEVDNAFVYVRE
jgi:chemotaxis protein methyltransferase CheR